MFHLILGHFLGAFFWQVMCDFKAWEGKNPKLKTMHKSKLKQGRYDHLKTIAQNGQKLNSKFKLSSKILNSTFGFWTQLPKYKLNPSKLALLQFLGLPQSLKRVQQAQDSRTLWFLKYFQLFLGTFEETTLSKFDSH